METINGLENINRSLSTHYTIYKIVNTINGKYYIGQHKTDNIYDDYMGSGNLILLAEQKYGLSAFTKTILFDFDNFTDMNNKEIELVQLSNCFPYDLMSYNIRPGGSNQLSPLSIQKGIETQKRNGKNLGENNPMFNHACTEFMSEEDIEKWKKNLSISGKKSYANDLERKKHLSKVFSGQNNHMYGHSCCEFMSEEKISKWKENISKATQGKNNPMFGKSSWEKCFKEERLLRIEKFKNSIKGKNKGKRCMKLPNETKWIFVKQEDVQKYLDLGYEFYSQQKGKHFKKSV